MKQLKQAGTLPGRARDIMNRHVVTIGPRDTLQRAMELMVENHVTGLPVVDEADRCVGLVSTTDILRYEQDHSEFTTEANSDVARFFDQTTQQWEDVRLTSYALEKFGELNVDEIMSRDLIFVSPGASIAAVARTMLNEEVHRVLVLDRGRRLLGLVTAIDFVRLAAKRSAKKEAAARSRTG
jgi:CBS domain-containing protein